MYVIILGWIISSIIVAAFANSRKIGFLETFFISLLLSPLVGSICMASSKKIDEYKLQEDILDSLKQIQNVIVPVKPIESDESKLSKTSDNYENKKIDYSFMTINEREEVMEKYGIRRNKWNGKYMYDGYSYDTLNDAVDYASK